MGRLPRVAYSFHSWYIVAHMVGQTSVSPHDVAKYILDRTSPMTGMKLQKLLFYSQAWSLVWDDVPLFDTDIEAWPKGPVIREIYNVHGSDAFVDEWPLGDATRLTEAQRKTIDNVLKTYAPMTAGVLSSLTHDEAPWIDARAGLKPTSKTKAVISRESMKAFYSSL